MNGVPYGSKWKALTGPRAGQVFTVNDRIGHGSEFDIWMFSCQACYQYGDPVIDIERVG